MLCAANLAAHSFFIFATATRTTAKMLKPSVSKTVLFYPLCLFAFLKDVSTV
jgi:hypothetical protein